MQPWDGGYEKGRFFEGIEKIDGNEQLQFEELLLKLSERLKGTSKNAQMSPNRGSGRHPASGFWCSVAPERLI